MDGLRWRANCHGLYGPDAERDAVKYLLGATGVSNNIRIKSERGLFKKADIGKALKHHCPIYDINMNVQVRCA